MTDEKLLTFYRPPHFFYLGDDKKLNFASMTPAKTVSVQELFDYIKNDPEARRLTDELRQMTDAEVPNFTKKRVKKEDFDAMKRDVPHYTTKPDKDGVVWVHYTDEDGTVSKKKQFKNTRFCFMQAAGVFTGRKMTDFVRPSGFVCVDFDHFAETPEELAKAKEELLADDKACPVLVFTSPSGDGLKALFCFDYTDDPEENEARLRGLYLYLETAHAGWLERGKNTHALDKYTDFSHCCNVPHDDDARLNKDGFTVLDWTFWRVEREKRTASNFVASGIDETKAKYYVEELVRSRIDVTDGMTWNEFVGLAHAFTGLSHGEELFHRVSELWPKYRESEARNAWNVARRQTSRADLTHFVKLATSAGIVPFEKSGLPEAEEAVRAWKDDFLASPAGEAWKEQKQNERKQTKQMTQEHKNTSASDEQALTEQELFDVVCKKRDFGELIHEAAQIAVSVPTGYVFGIGNEKEDFTLKSQALTVVGAGTSHGKTRFLENVLLRVANHEDEETSGTTVFFTLEESLADVLAELVNVNTGRHEVRHEEFVNNFTAYADAFRRIDDPTNGKKYFPNDAEFEQAKKDIFAFGDKFLNSDRLLIIDDERFRDVDVLCRALDEFVNSGHKLKAVLLDHLGMMTTKDKSLSANAPKTERVEHIVTRLELAAKSLNVPFVVTSQLARTASGALSLENGNLADSSDVERSANTVVLLWNSSVLPTGQTEKDLNKNDGVVKSGRSLKESGFFYGIRGALFAKLTKRRGGLRDVWTVFDFDGATGQIKDMTPDRVAELQARFDNLKDTNAVANLKDGESHTDADGTVHVAQRQKNGKTLHFTSAKTDDAELAPSPELPLSDYAKGTAEEVQNFNDWQSEQAATQNKPEDDETLPF